MMYGKRYFRQCGKQHRHTAHISLNTHAHSKRDSQVGGPNAEQGCPLLSDPEWNKTQLQQTRSEIMAG